jgi:hypothetical protein
VAVIGIALISMGEDIGAEMAYRTFGHLVNISIFSCAKAASSTILLSCYPVNYGFFFLLAQVV